MSKQHKEPQRNRVRNSLWRIFPPLSKAHLGSLLAFSALSLFVTACTPSHAGDGGTSDVISEITSDDAAIIDGHTATDSAATDRGIADIAVPDHTGFELSLRDVQHADTQLPDAARADQAAVDSYIGAVDAADAAQDAAVNSGCVIEGVAFDAEQASCALQFFERMNCDECDTLFDSRICEDAINDASACMIGDSCTGCTDDDDRDDGVSCAEIEAYSFFGASAAGILLAQVQNNPCIGSVGDDAGNAAGDAGDCVANCSNRECGPDPVCGQSCGSCENISPAVDCADNLTRVTYSGTVDCVSGQCIPHAVEESCPEGQVCSAGSCQDQPERCGSSLDCGVGNHCTSRTMTCTTGECATDFDCDLGEKCSGGACTFIPIGSVCYENLDCGVGRRCFGATGLSGTCKLWECNQMTDCNGLGVDYDAFSTGCKTRDGYQVCVYLDNIPCKWDYDCGTADRCDPFTYTCTRFTNETWVCPCADCGTCLNNRCMDDSYSGLCWGGADCRGGNNCAASGYCEDWDCSNNLDCSYGNACINGTVIQCDTTIMGNHCSRSWGDSCDQSTNCGNGMLCTNGTCLPDSSCGSSADCPEKWGCPSTGFNAHLCHPWYEISCVVDEDCPVAAKCIPTVGGGRCSPS